uniref:HAT C-terminal dimerisation domain-containing protein n=1 Tax=Paramormyrops kingsleyae TaxID=1676925 RepID=A0A3B3RTZ4_9TELE
MLRKNSKLKKKMCRRNIEQKKKDWARLGLHDGSSRCPILQHTGFLHGLHHSYALRVVNVTLTLASCNLAFRGHREVLGQPNSGNFLSIIELLACYDPVLKELISRPQGTIKYLSPTIQNELIHILSLRVQQNITADINEGPFFSIIMDTTQDLSKHDQLSQVYRYVTIVRNAMDKAVDIKVMESFLGFMETMNTSHYANSLDISKCRGQGYDGAANMSGIYLGVQARIWEKEPLATYVHCAAHNLNLVLNDAVKNISEMERFYETIEHIYTFFGNSIKRWTMLTGIVTTDGSDHPNVTLKRLCPTRWSSRFESLSAIRYRYVDLMKALTKIALTSDKRDERNEAVGLMKSMEKFSFIFLVVVQAKVLETVNAVSKTLQKTDTDIQTAMQLLENSIQILSDYRSAFDQAKATAQMLASKWGVQTTFENVRPRRVKRHFDELSEDERLTNAEKYFRVQIFNATLDIIISQLSQRFSCMRETCHVFEAIRPMTLQIAGDDELFEKAKRLSDHYSRDIAPTFPTQLLSFRSCFKAEISQKSSILQLAKMLVVDYDTVTSTFGEVCTALMLFLTLPVTVATAERSFSKLKLIKTYLRSSMGQERLSGSVTYYVSSPSSGSGKVEASLINKNKLMWDHI